MLRFAEPSYLNMIWLVVIGAIFFAFYDRVRLTRLQEAFGKKMGSFLTTSVSLPKRRLHIALQALTLIFFLIALARPQLGSRQEEVKQTGTEMIFAVDVSNSMLAEDDKPSRLEHAKKELSRLLDKLSGDKVGILAFAGSAALISPLTSDYSALKMFLEGLSPDSVSTQGTNFRSVIETAMKAFERGGVEGEGGATPTRVIFFASDGEDNNDKSLDGIIKKAYDAGIRIFGLGFGTVRGALIPIRDERGNLTGYKKDQQGQPVNTVPDEQFLSHIAQTGGGAYYHSTFDETELSSLLQDLGKLQKADFQSKMSVAYDEKFQIPLIIGLIFAALDFLLGTRRKSNQFWHGRFEVSS